MNFKRIIQGNCVNITDNKNCTYDIDNLFRSLIIGTDNKRTELNKLVHNACERKANGEMINLKRHFYIKNKYKIIKIITETRNICLIIKTRSFKINKENKITADYKFERTSKDFMDHSLRDVGYIMSIIDIYTRFTKLYFLETIDTNNVTVSKHINDEVSKANKIITEALTINKGKTIKEVNRCNFYNILNLPKPLSNTVCKRYKIGDRVYKIKFNSEKLDLNMNYS
ncbi:hypothetical protein NAPIS_ORF02002 [Vairimorpha apis BRL 01]|uniref:Uncharacterized protein n=1 Tax=Vairimorpha apis BRL 01 TaxID=1037528 RepID=T0KYW9_9MICR|nr:hypothetical protein NAPIS_ORF02002 [Vairimorpha apis BRL 01]